MHIIIFHIVCLSIKTSGHIQCFDYNSSFLRSKFNTPVEITKYMTTKTTNKMKKESTNRDNKQFLSLQTNK